MGHGQAFTAVCDDGGIFAIWDIPHDPIGCSRSATMFNVVPVATITILETMFNMGLLAISGCRS
eukprot:6206979-Pleurochrysis_carterae.AAC.1